MLCFVQHGSFFPLFYCNAVHVKYFNSTRYSGGGGGGMFNSMRKSGVRRKKDGLQIYQICLLWCFCSCGLHFHLNKMLYSGVTYRNLSEYISIDQELTYTTTAVYAEVTLSQLPARLCGALLHFLCPWCWTTGWISLLPVVSQHMYQ